MNFKKLGIAGVLGFFAMALVGGITFELFYKNHMGSMAQQYSDVITFPPNMGPAMLGGIFYIFVITYIYDRMGVDSAQSGAVTGAWFGAAKWIFIDTQWMAMMPKLFPVNFVVVDVALSAVMYAISGAVIGWALNRFK
ncbi:MAG: hypothetical protein VX887_01760 [Candidatus Neomarinimicrobiota bacterium]|nr:hypothetical protein [Candidatus Neomarinimicrobiota bacterium]